MRQIIQGKRYDTATAECLHQWDNRRPPNDVSYCTEDLYKTVKGNYFLYGEGGPMSKYARAVGTHETTGGVRLTPLTPDDARQWLEEHEGTAILEAEFPDSIEDA